MFRKIFIATTPFTMLAAVAVKKADSKEPAATSPQKAAAAGADSASVDEFPHYKCKRSELPLYTPLHAHNKPQEVEHPAKKSFIRDNIESAVRVVRVELQTGLDAVSSQKESLENYWETAKAHTQSSIDYLNQPHNVLPRSGAIAIGGLAGFIFAARGGFIKKVIYTTAGAGTIASLCYPRQAEQFARDALYEARKGYAITYNFVKGVKPGDEVPVEPISKFPTSLQDLKYMALDLYEEAKEAVFSSKK